jgi:hypothetical protein
MWQNGGEPWPQSIFRKKPAPAQAGVDTGFPSENAITQKYQSGFCFLLKSL